jgi:ribokinase
VSRVAVVGSSILDVAVVTPCFPRPGETVRPDALGLYPGGKGFNQALALARLGHEVLFISRLGDDPLAEVFRREMAAAGIDDAHVGTDPAGTGVGIPMIAPGGDCRIIAHPRANLGLTPADVDAAAGGLSRCAAVLAQLEVPVAVVARAFEIVKKAGGLTVLNAAPAAGLPDAIWPRVDVLVVNEVEASFYPGVEVTDVRSATDALPRLLELGPSRVVVTLGDKGLVAGDGEEVVVLPALEVEAVDATGAGDAFCGALAAGLVEGKNFAEALGRANAAGAFAVMRMGAGPSMPTRAELDRFLNKRVVFGS